jgi:chemotaxis protein CheD
VINNRKKYFLTEGQMLITTSPLEIITVLGSCVSICLWDKRKQIGGINHYLLPGNDGEEAGDFHRGNTSNRMLIKSMINRKCELSDLEAKVFGGCNSLYQENDTFEVGKKNIEVAMNQLRGANISVVASHTGGMFGRKIVFNTRTGKVLMRLLKKTSIQINDEIYKGLGV